MQTTTEFERTYLAWANRLLIIILLLHIPAAMGVAAWFDTGIFTGLIVSCLLVAGPVTLFLMNRSSLWTSNAAAVATMGMSALLIHLSKGTIDMHFHIFAALAFLVVFGRIWPLLSAAVVIALHHVVFWAFMPASVFNYQASFGVVLFHAFFVVFEIVPCCYIAQRLGRAIKAQGITSGQLEKASEEIESAASQVSESSAHIAHGTSDQAATLEETSAASQEIRAMTERNAENATTAAALMADVDHHVGEANQALAHLSASMADVRTSSERIAKIMKIIDEIAFQTNILALNAAVEAARAGEAGMGFSVVADEVRNLAGRCSEAARETSGLIDESVANSRKGTERLSKVTAVIAVITESTGKVKDLVHEVSVAGSDQAKGIEQIARALTHLEAITQRAAANAEENAAAGQELQSQARSMRGVVEALQALS